MWIIVKYKSSSESSIKKILNNFSSYDSEKFTTQPCMMTQEFHKKPHSVHICMNFLYISGKGISVSCPLVGSQFNTIKLKQIKLMWHWMFAGFHPKYMLEITRVREIRICPSPLYPGDPVLWVKIFQLCGENTSQSVENPRGMQRLPHATVTRGPFFWGKRMGLNLPGPGCPTNPRVREGPCLKKVGRTAGWNNFVQEMSQYLPGVVKADVYIINKETWWWERKKSLITTSRDGCVSG